MVRTLPPAPVDLEVPLDVADLPRPRYGSRSVADLLPAVIGHLSADASAGPEPMTGLRTDRVVVLVVDGLGVRQLSRVPGIASTLRALPGEPIDAVFPTTTAASIASIGTGRPPSQHGIVGYTFALPDHDHPLNALVWRVGLRGGGFDARQAVVPESLQPDPTAFERAVAAGIDTTVVLDSDHLDSGLTRAALRGGQRRLASGLYDSLRAAVDAVADDDGPALAYVHHPLVDRAGHESGPCSADWRDAVTDLEATLSRLRPRLPQDVTILITADHGMLSIAERDVVELSTDPELLDGVRVLAGEPRVRHLALEQDADTIEVARRWRAALGDRALVLSREEALPLFGGEPTPAARAHIGDLVVIARGTTTLVHARIDPDGGRLAGHHGGLTRAERLVPCWRLEAG